MMGLGYGSTSLPSSQRLSLLQDQEVAKELRGELNTRVPPAFKYAGIPLEKGSPPEKHNVLFIEFIVSPAST